MSGDEARTQELLSILGEVDFVRLVEARGGLRLFVPHGVVIEDLGETISDKLRDRYAGSYLRVPLARAFRARLYRERGMSNAAIARKLGITETGVDKLFQRMPNKPAKGSRDPRQIDLFQPE